MAHRLGIFVDVNDQFFRINKKWEGRKLDYKKYYNLATDYGEVCRALAYGTQIEKTANKFISCLYHIGFEPKYKTVEENKWFNWSVGIAIDMAQLASRIDTAILGVSNKDIIPAVTYMQDRGVRMIIIGVGINKELKEVADHWIELDEEMLENKINLISDNSV